MELPEHELQCLPDGGWCPNNPSLPLIIYRQALSGHGEELAREFEHTFARHGWPPAWRYTIFDYPHYHSTAHEVIGVFRGWADVRFGDTTGLTSRLETGDVVIIPAGVSHERLDAAADFQGVGAYPEGCEVDEQRIERNDRDGAVQRIAVLPLPEADPLLGAPGLVRSHWRRA
jgi:uncharacterized protein YjlB